MKYKDLTHKRDPTSDTTLKDEQKFIYWYGLFNCKMLKFRDAVAVIGIMNGYDAPLEEKEVKFIQENADREVLCYVCQGHDSRFPDIFVYGDDNIAFRVECFV